MITSCICFKKSFKQILKIADDNSFKYLSQIQKEFNICNKCRLCNPYIRRMLITRETTFNANDREN